MKKNKTTDPTGSETYSYLKPCSAQDCTGLIPSGPVDEKEMEDYEELYPFLPEVPDESKCRS